MKKILTLIVTPSYADTFGARGIPDEDAGESSDGSFELRRSPIPHLIYSKLHRKSKEKNCSGRRLYHPEELKYLFAI
jgi:hypothetical protein